MSISDAVLVGLILMVVWWAREIILVAVILIATTLWALVAGIFGK